MLLLLSKINLQKLSLLQ